MQASPQAELTHAKKQALTNADTNTCLHWQHKFVFFSG